ncbi:MAG: hypothetical protein AB8B55_00120 [Mariniblastus sp.]
MPEKNPIVKLEKILKFYNQKLELIQIQHQQQMFAVQQIKNAITHLEQERERTQQQAEAGMSDLSNHEHSIEVLRLIQMRINKKQIDHNNAEALRAEIKQNMLDQMSKSKSLEKLIERKTQLLLHDRLRREQGMADDQNLNRQLTRRAK